MTTVTELVQIVTDVSGVNPLDWSRKDARSYCAKKVLIKLIYDIHGYSYRSIGRHIGTSHVNVRHHLNQFDSDMVFLSGLSELYYKVLFKVDRK